jgi:3-hydroxymyristoyl/3-hydroxydecanoyl-(acyl carrier protein) dehydratase
MTNNLNTKSVLSLFDAEDTPNIKALEVNSEGVKVSMNVPSELSYFEGHFPGHKVLPGVVQVHWAGTLAKLLFPELGAFTKLVNIKFQKMVLPDAALELDLTCALDKTQIQFHYHDDDGTFSKGVLKFKS